jgi:hypothetical protein
MGIDQVALERGEPARGERATHAARLRETITAARGSRHADAPNVIELPAGADDASSAVDRRPDERRITPQPQFERLADSRVVGDLAGAAPPTVAEPAVVVAGPTELTDPSPAVARGVQGIVTRLRVGRFGATRRPDEG